MMHTTGARDTRSYVHATRETRSKCSHLLIYLLTYLLIYLLTYLLTYLATLDKFAPAQSRVGPAATPAAQAR